MVVAHPIVDVVGMLTTEIVEHGIQYLDQAWRDVFVGIDDTVNDRVAKASNVFDGSSASIYAAAPSATHVACKLVKELHND